jgi:hypothetical protein
MKHRLVHMEIYITAYTTVQSHMTDAEMYTNTQGKTQSVLQHTNDTHCTQSLLYAHFCLCDVDCVL